MAVSFVLLLTESPLDTPSPLPFAWTWAIAALEAAPRRVLAELSFWRDEPGVDDLAATLLGCGLESIGVVAL